LILCQVGNLSVSQLCQPPRVITAVNGQLPGPAIHAREGDTVVVHLVNQSPYNITIHWYGLSHCHIGRIEIRTNHCNVS
jgi:laccase